MSDFNCSIYISETAVVYADFYLSMRGIKYKSRKCADGTIEISAREKFEKVLDNLAKRCYNINR